MPPHFRFANEKAPKLSFQEQKKLLKAFLQYYPRYKKLLFLTLLAALVVPAASSISPLIILEALKTYLPAGDTFKVTVSMVLVILLLLLMTGEGREEGHLPLLTLALYLFL